MTNQEAVVCLKYAIDSTSVFSDGGRSTGGYRSFCCQSGGGECVVRIDEFYDKYRLERRVLHLSETILGTDFRLYGRLTH